MNIFKNKLSRLLTVLCLASTISLVACDPGVPSGQTGFVASGAAAPLSQAEFDQLPPEQQYQVASKLYATFFRGISAEDFFDMSDGVDTLRPKKANFIGSSPDRVGSHHLAIPSG